MRSVLLRRLRQPNGSGIREVGMVVGSLRLILSPGRYLGRFLRQGRGTQTLCPALEGVKNLSDSR